MIWHARGGNNVGQRTVYQSFTYFYHKHTHLHTANADILLVQLCIAAICTRKEVEPETYLSHYVNY